MSERGDSPEPALITGSISASAISGFADRSGIQRKANTCDGKPYTQSTPETAPAKSRDFPLRPSDGRLSKKLPPMNHARRQKGISKQRSLKNSVKVVLESFIGGVLVLRGS